MADRVKRGLLWATLLVTALGTIAGWLNIPVVGKSVGLGPLSTPTSTAVPDPKGGDPHSPTKAAEGSGGAKWTSPDFPALPWPPGKLEPFSSARPSPPGAASRDTLPPDQPKREPGASFHQPVPPELLASPAAKLEPLPSAPPSPRGAASYHTVPPDQPKREPGASSYQPVPPESRRQSGAASFQPLPSSSSQPGR